MVRLGLSSSYHNQNCDDYRSASVITICNLEYVIRICNLIDLCHDRLRMDQDLLGQLYNQVNLVYNVTGSSVVKQCDRYPEVAGSIPAQFQLYFNFQISWASELTMIVYMHLIY